MSRHGDALEQADRNRLSRRDVVKRGAALGMAATVAGTPFASGSAARLQPDARTLVVASYGSPIDLDPHSAVEDRSALAIRGAYEQLIALEADKTDEYEGLIAESWEANDDNTVWTFHLRPGITFHDGSPCDAEAVRASFERLLALELAPAYEMFRFLTDPAQITTPDPLTVVFDLGQPQPLFESGVSSQYGGQIVNAKRLRELESEGDWGHGWAELNQEGLGTGPYRITSFEPGEQVTLERFDGYWREWQEGQFEQVVIRVVPESAARRQLVERGEADIVDGLDPEALAALESNPELVIDHSYSTEVDYVILTVAGPLQSPEARRALCYAFPYDEVIDGVYKGYGKRAVGPVAELCRGFAPGTFQYQTDLDMARELLAQAGVAAGTELTLMMDAGDPADDATVQLFQANLAEIGITLSVETVDFGALTAVLFRDVAPEEQPNMMQWGWWPAYNDAWSHLQAQVLCSAQGSAGTNAGYYCNPRVDELLTRARDATDPVAYEQVLAEVQQILSRDDPPAIYYLQPQWATVLRRDIAGFAFNPIYVGTFDFFRLRRTA